LGPKLRVERLDLAVQIATMRPPHRGGQALAARTGFLAICAAVLAALICSSPAPAQVSDQYIGIYYTKKFLDQKRVAKPEKQTRVRLSEPTRPPSLPEDYEVKPSFFAAVLGDNFAEWLAYGLDQAFEDVPELGILSRARLGSGLAKSEPVDWPVLARELLAKEEKVDFVVFTAGEFDRDAIKLGDQTHPFRSDVWQETYLKRLDALMAALKSRGVPVFYIGLPPSSGARFADNVYLNAMARDRAEAAGVTYIDVWGGFVDDKGEYSAFGPDVVGQSRRLRTADGLYFTRAGARKYALYVEQPLRNLLTGRIGGGLTSPVEPLKVPEFGIPVPDAAEISLPEGPAPVVPRRLVGPIEPLTGTAIQPVRASVLAGAASPTTSTPKRSLPVPVEGRADDNRWTAAPGAGR